MHSPFQEGITYISDDPNLLSALEGQTGTFEVNHNGQLFTVNCEEVPGRSPVLTSLIPSGTKNVWLIKRVAPETIEAPEPRTRTVGAGR